MVRPGAPTHVEKRTGARERDERPSVEAVYRLHGERLWRSILAYSGDPAVADDAVAEAFTQLIRRGAEVRSPADWVWRAAFRIAGGELQRQSRCRHWRAEDHHRRHEDPEPAWTLVDALRLLSPQQRAIVVLRDYAGYSSRETADIIGSTEPSVRVQLSRARRSLRRELSS